MPCLALEFDMLDLKVKSNDIYNLLLKEGEQMIKQMGYEESMWFSFHDTVLIFQIFVNLKLVSNKVFKTKNIF